MEATLKIIGAVIAVVASGVGVIAAVEQLTLRARLRRTTELMRTLLDHEKDPARETVLRSIHDLAAARLATGLLVPWWRFTQVVVWFLVIPPSLGLIVASQGLSEVIWGLVALTAVFGITTARSGTRLFRERQRIVREYLLGERVKPPLIGLFDRVEGLGTELLVAVLISGGTNLFAVGVGMLLRGGGTWDVTFAFVGALVTWLAYGVESNRTIRPLEVAPLTHLSPRSHRLTGASTPAHARRRSRSAARRSGRSERG